MLVLFLGSSSDQGLTQGKGRRVPPRAIGGSAGVTAAIFARACAYELSAWGATLSLGFAALLMSLPMSAGIALLAWLAHKPGEGPTEEAMRNKNWFQYYFVGTIAEAVPRTLVARVHGRDGGYGETAMMLAGGRPCDGNAACGAARHGTRGGAS